MKNRYLSFLVSFGLLGAVIYISDVGKVVNALLSANPFFIGIGLSIWLTGAFLRISRWRLLLRHIDIDTSPWETASIFLSGFYISNLTPAKAGDPARALLLKRQHGKSLSKTMSSLVMERLADLVIMMSIIAVGLFYLPPVLPPELLYVVTAFALLVIGGILFVVPSRDRTEGVFRLIYRLFSFIPLVRGLEDRIEGAADRLSGSFSTYGESSFLVHLILLTLAIWFLEGGLGTVAFRAVGVEVPYIWVLTIMPLANLAGVVSLLPGGLGASEAVGISFFVIVLGISISQATAAALLGRAMSYWMYILVGAVVMASLGEL